MKTFDIYFSIIGLKNTEFRKYIIALLIFAPLFLNPLKIKNFENNDSKFKFSGFSTITTHYNNLIEIEKYLNRNNYNSTILLIITVFVYLILHFAWALVVFSFWFFVIKYIYKKFLI